MSAHFMTFAQHFDNILSLKPEENGSTFCWHVVKWTTVQRQH